MRRGESSNGFLINGGEKKRNLNASWKKGYFVDGEGADFFLDIAIKQEGGRGTPPHSQAGG